MKSITGRRQIMINEYFPNTSEEKSFGDNSSPDRSVGFVSAEIRLKNPGAPALSGCKSPVSD